MPPRKKQRTSGQRSQAVAAGEATTRAASDIKDVNDFQLKLDAWIDATHGLRHHVEKQLPCEPTEPLGFGPQPGQFAWPLCEGGTLKDIAQRAWSDPDHLLALSARMTHAAGLLDTDSVEDFKTHFCTIPGEQMVLRMPSSTDATVDSSNRAVGTLLYGDGSQKMLAAFTAWIGLLSLWESEPNVFDNDQVQGLIASFLSIPTCTKSSVESNDSLTATIGRIVKQNIDSKVLPVSSFQWNSILRSLKVEVKLDVALRVYNSHPDVVAHDESGSGCVTLDNRKKQGVQNWFERTCDEALAVVLQSTHDLAFSYGCFGESFSLCNFAFLGSAANLMASETADLTMRPLDKEPFVSVDWRLPMTASAQVLLFKRVQEQFNRTTTGIPVNQRKKYRLTSEDLVKLRNCCVLFEQCFHFLEAQVGSEAVSWRESFINGHDEDWRVLLDVRPSTVALSMLQSVQEKARETLLQKENIAMKDVEDQRQQVLEAEWKLFCSGLKKDQETVKLASDAPRQVKMLQHAREVEQRKSQAADGLKAASGYQEAYLRVVKLAKMELATAEVSKMKSTELACSRESISILGFADMNVPKCRQKEVCQSICNGIAAINADGPAEQNATLLLLPDLPRDSSPRGLWDEEKRVFEALFSLQQHVETRFVECFTREKKGEVKSNARRFSMGRVVCNSASMDDCIWMSGELAMYGRPVGAAEVETGAPTSVLPKQSELLLPESASTSQDLRLSEKPKPSPEQTSAQKGIARAKALLEAALRGVSPPGPVLVINLTGYVEEVGAAELDRIPGSAILKSPDALRLEVTVRDGTIIDIHPDHKKKWSQTAYAGEFERLAKQHAEGVKDLLKPCLERTAAQEPAQASTANDTEDTGGAAASAAGENLALKAYESFEALNGEDEIKDRVNSEVTGVEILKSKDKLYLMSEKARVLGKHTILGGFGTGKLFELKRKFVPCTEQCDGVDVKWANGDKTLVQAEMASISPQSGANVCEVMTLYRYLTLLERSKKISKYELSYSKCTRSAASGSSGPSDAFNIEISEPHKFRVLPNLEQKMTCKSFFHNMIKQVEESDAICPIFRWRFERIHGVSKIQKPYVALTGALKLEPGKPVAL
ncbi:unnamed protein product [Symbiodinium sp. CCMP2592]|nr:unnamed protein product [Symbiodinium sp. CCMP2592]CAE7255180.1 unnamed protein product [Symbiodinium sp. CCMP2592]